MTVLIAYLAGLATLPLGALTVSLFLAYRAGSLHELASTWNDPAESYERFSGSLKLDDRFRAERWHVIGPIWRIRLTGPTDSDKTMTGLTKRWSSHRMSWHLANWHGEYLSQERAAVDD